MRIIIFISAILAYLPIYAQNDSSRLEFNYITEGQHNFLNGKFNWANLLHTQAELATRNLGLWRNGTFNAELLSVYSTAENRIAGDFQYFSNIEADNMALGIFALGYTHHFERVTIFGGIGNLEMNYFTTPYTSSFINSSYGVFPTLSFNFPMAVFPYSAMSVNVETQISERFTLRNSIFNGVAEGAENKYDLEDIFRVSPRIDGLLFVNEIEYAYKTGIYDLGAAYHSGKNNYSIWANAERRITKNNSSEIGLLVQGGLAPLSKSICTNYFGVGGVIYGLLSKDNSDLMGLIVNRAKFKEATETALELTLMYEINNNLHLQPNLQYIVTGSEKALIGLLRVSYSFDALKKRGAHKHISRL